MQPLNMVIMSKRIYIITPTVGNINNAAARRINSFIEPLTQEGFNVFVISSKCNQTQKNFKHIPTYIKLKSNKEGLILRALYEILWGFEVLIRLIISPKNTLILGSSPPYLSFLIYGLIGLLNKNLILDIRDLYPEMYIYSNILDVNSKAVKLLKLYTAFIYKRARAITTVTNSMKSSIEITLNKQNVSLIRNGFPKQLDKFSKKRYLDNEFRIVFHGTLGKVQNINLLVEIIDSLKLDKRIKFIVIGDGPKSNLIKECKGNLDYYRDMEFHDMFDLISTCHLGISLRNDGHIGRTAIPVKIYEYLGLGIPVICTPNSGDVYELQNEGFNIRMCKNQKKEIILNLLDIQKNYQNRTYNNSQFKSNLSREHQSKNLIKLLNEISG